MHKGFSIYLDTTISPIRGSWFGCKDVDKKVVYVSQTHEQLYNMKILGLT